MEAASKSQLSFSRHQEALEETPPLSKASTSTLTCNGSDRRRDPASPPGQAQQAGAPALQPRAQGLPARMPCAGRLGWGPAGYFSEAG